MTEKEKELFDGWADENFSEPSEIEKKFIDYIRSKYPDNEKHWIDNGDADIIGVNVYDDKYDDDYCRSIYDDEYDLYRNNHIIDVITIKQFIRDKKLKDILE